jgi:hypothetical protein
MTREESTNVVEIDAIANEEWERDQHTPQAIESNLAALVKQSASVSPAPTRQLDGGSEDPAKPRTTANTLRRPDDGKRNKTMALPVTVKPPSMPTTKSTSQGLTPVAATTTPPKPTPVVKPLEPRPALAKSSSPALTPVAKAVGAKPTASSSSPALTPVAKPVEKKASIPALTPVAAKPMPIEKPTPAKTSSPAPTPIATKPVAAKPVEKPTPAKASIPALTPVAAKPVEKPAPAKASIPAVTPVAAKPVEANANAVEVKAAPTPPPMGLPQWPPKSDTQGEYDDWENPHAATSIGNRAPAKPRTVSEDAISSFLKEDSIIIDLNAVPNEPAAKRRPQTFPVIQSSDLSTTTSGVFDMPSPSAATVVLVAPPVSADLATAALGPSSTWNTPLPQPMPGEPNAAPPVPSWPSAAGLDHGLAIPEQVKQEPTGSGPTRRPRLATVFATLHGRRNAVLIATGVSVLVLLVEFAWPSPSAKTAAAPVPSVTTHVAARAETPAAKPTQASPAAATPAKPPAVADADPVTQDHAKPAQQPVKRRISSKKPVVVDYDKKLDPVPSQDESLASARAAYASGNQHLFAGETDAAITAYKKALEDYPTYAAGYRGLGLAYTQHSDRVAALTAFKAYVKLAPAAKDMALIFKRMARLSAALAIRR